MNLEKELLKDRSKAHIQRMASYISNNEKHFESLMHIVLRSENDILRQRSAWLMSTVFDTSPFLLMPYLEQLIDMLGENNLHDALKRNITRVLQAISIPENLQGKALDACYRLFRSSEEAVAIKVFAMSVVANIIQNYPELKEEFLYDIEQQYPYSSAGFRSRAKKIITNLKKRSRL